MPEPTPSIPSSLFACLFFFNRIVVMWNSLPPSVRCAEIISVFKKGVTVF